MLKNITLSANQEKIKKLREVAEKQGTTANALFREWLDNIAPTLDNSANSVDSYFERMDKAGINAGRKFTREEMNER
jgi:DNA-binding protein H-NS